MEKKKLDDYTKTKLIYSGELIIIALILIVIGILQATGVMNVSETFLHIFKFLAIAGGCYFLYDIITTFTNKRKREKACLVDKFTTIIIPPYTITISILLFAGNEFVWQNPKYFITPLIFYIAAIYIFQGIYHWFFPLKILFEDEEEKKDDNVVVDTQEAQVIEEEDKKDSE